MGIFNTLCDTIEHVAIVKSCGSYSNYAAVINNLNFVHELQNSKQHAGTFIEAQTSGKNPFAKLVRAKKNPEITLPKVDISDDDEE